MHTSRNKFYLAILAGALSLPALGTSTAFDEDHERARAMMEAGEILPLEEILKRLPQNSTGIIIEVELEEEDGRHVYEIEILDTQGKVMEWLFDARSGDFLRKYEEED